MARYERQTTINAPADRVFEYVSDISRHPEWAGDRLETEKTSDGPVGVGTTFACVGHQMGSHRGQITVTELEPGQRIVFEAQDDTGHYRHHFVVQQADEGVQLTKGFEPLKLSLMMTLMSPLLGIMVPRTLGADLQRIKARLEG